MSHIIDRLLHAPDPHLILKHNDDKTRLPLLHQAEGPATTEELQQLAQALNGAGDDLLELYRRHNGLALYAERSDPECALLFLPVAEMAVAKEDLGEWLDMDDSSLEEDEIGAYTTDEGTTAYWGVPDWWDSAVVFARFGYTPECLMMPTAGEYAGHVFIYEHDGGDGTSWVSDSVSALLHILIEQPLPFFKRY